MVREWDTVHVADVDAGSVDNCTMIMAQIKFMGEPDSLYRDNLLVDCSMIGVDTMIVLKVEDCWANAALCMTSLQVLDTLPPFLICPDDTILSCITFQNYRISPNWRLPRTTATWTLSYMSMSWISIRAMSARSPAPIRRRMPAAIWCPAPNSSHWSTRLHQ